MNSSLAIIQEESLDRFPHHGSSPAAIRLVHGADSHAESSPVQIGAPLDSEKALTPTLVVTATVTQPVAKQTVQAITPQAAAVADIEHFTAQIDLEKVVLIPAGVTINGDISTGGLASLIISGTVNGTVDAGKGSVIVQETGVVNGTVKSDDTIVVAGSVTSPSPNGLAIETNGLWLLSETGRVRGDVAYARHRAYEGAFFSGRAIPFSEHKK